MKDPSIRISANLRLASRDLTRELDSYDRGRGDGGETFGGC